MTQKNFNDDDNELVDFEKKNFEIIDDPSKELLYSNAYDPVEQERLRWEQETKRGTKKKTCIFISTFFANYRLPHRD